MMKRQPNSIKTSTQSIRIYNRMTLRPMVGHSHAVKGVGRVNPVDPRDDNVGFISNTT